MSEPLDLAAAAKLARLSSEARERARAVGAREEAERDFRLSEPVDLEAAENLARAIEDPARYWEERCASAETAYRDVWRWWQKANGEVERLRAERRSEAEAYLAGREELRDQIRQLRTELARRDQQASDVAAARRQIWQLEADNRSLIAEIKDLRELVAAMRYYRGPYPDTRERTTALIKSLGIGTS
jgi:cell division protein FtsB